MKKYFFVLVVVAAGVALANPKKETRLQNFASVMGVNIEGVGYGK